MEETVQSDGQKGCFSYGGEGKRPTALIVVAACVVALGVFFTVPFTSFIFPSSRKAKEQELQYISEIAPPDIPDLPPRVFVESEMLEMREPVIEAFTAEDLDIPINPVFTEVVVMIPEVELNFDLLDTDRDDAYLFAYASSEVDQKPSVLSRSVPEYPEVLKNKGIVGEVWVEFVVDEKGGVRRPHVTKSTNDAFNASAITSIRAWDFEPGERGGVPVKTRVLQSIKFSLKIILED